MGENEQALLESAAEQDAAQQDSQQDEEQQPEETVDKSNSGEAQQSPMSMLRLICINMHALGYGLFYASVGVLVLPEEAIHMWPDQHAIFLAIMLVLAGISQLVSPAIGYVCDRTFTRFGRRLPFILGGNLVLFLCLGAMFLARTYRYGWWYLLLLFVAVTALNVAYTGYTGLVSDLVPPAQMGLGSGLMGGLTAFGAVLGLVLVGFVVPLEGAYGVYALAVIFTTPFTALSAGEDCSCTQRPLPFLRAELAKSYWISPATHGDFFYIFVSRTFYYMAVSIQIYILYYLRDVMQEPEIKADPDKYTAILCIVSQSAAGVVSTASGAFSDRVGRRNSIYFSCTVMACVYVGYCFTGTFPAVIVLGLVYGSSNGIYLAVDYALAVDCLPSHADHAKDLALWGIAAFLGTMFGPCVTGPLLTAFGTYTEKDDTAVPQVHHYNFAGYCAVMLMGVLYSGICGAYIAKVHKGDAPWARAPPPPGDVAASEPTAREV